MGPPFDRIDSPSVETDEEIAAQALAPSRPRGLYGASSTPSHPARMAARAPHLAILFLFRRKPMKKALLAGLALSLAALSPLASAQQTQAVADASGQAPKTRSQVYQELTQAIQSGQLAALDKTVYFGQ
jgi:hypothetical protein